ncbi:MAG: ribosome maturation factor RimP [Candidatus Kapaibacterium sp.]
MTNTFKTAIVEILTKPAARLAAARGLHLLRIQVRGTESTPVIEVLLDGDRPIVIDDCESVSKDLSVEIDTAKLIKGNYRLDVMSPGLEEPLVEDWQFARSIGRLVEVQYQDDNEHHTLHGHLRAYTPKEVAIEPVHIKTPKVVKPNLIVTDSGPIAFEQDEQLYDPPVELVKIERRHLIKVFAQPEFGR